jgi:hypothetical protein
MSVHRTTSGKSSHCSCQGGKSDVRGFLTLDFCMLRTERIIKKLNPQAQILKIVKWLSMNIDCVDRQVSGVPLKLERSNGAGQLHSSPNSDRVTTYLHCQHRISHPIRLTARIQSSSQKISTRSCGINAFCETSEK